MYSGLICSQAKRIRQFFPTNYFTLGKDTYGKLLIKSKLEMRGVRQPPGIFC
jgi:hypothetical protein